MHPDYQIVIPTRNSARWIASFLKAYRNLGVEPLYLVDTRSADDTGPKLKAMQAHTEYVTPPHDRVESVLSFLPQFVEQDWVVRFDDDEMPSMALINWLGANIASYTEPVVALSRRDCLLKENRLYYSRLEDFYFFLDNPCYLDPQWRAFRHREVIYNDAIHTAGFKLDTDHQLAPQEAYFIHLDWVLRSFEERLSKLEGYEKQAEGGGRNFAQFYLPELHHAHDLRLAELDTDEFNLLAQSISRPNQPIIDLKGAVNFHDLDATIAS